MAVWAERRLTLAAAALLTVLVIALAVQLGVAMGWMNADLVWGGRLQEKSIRTRGAAAALIVLLLMVLVVIAGRGWLGLRLRRVGRAGLWCMAFFFLLNTVGNLLAADKRESWMFAPLTLVAGMLAVVLARGIPASPTRPHLEEKDDPR